MFIFKKEGTVLCQTYIAVARCLFFSCSRCPSLESSQSNSTALRFMKPYDKSIGQLLYQPQLS